MLNPSSNSNNNGSTATYIPQQRTNASQNHINPQRVQVAPPDYGSAHRVGNSTLRCNGCCIFTTDSCNGLYLVVVVWVVVIIFLSSVIPPTEIFSWVITMLLFVWSQLMHFFASACDPGILVPAPKGSRPPEPELVKLAGGKTMEAKVCTSCNINRPPRSSHCSICDYCVEEFDHHCGVVGSCVAKRTFRYFTWYFYASGFLSLYIMVRSVVFLSSIGFGSSGPLDTSVVDGDWGRWRVAAAVICTMSTFCGICCFFGNAMAYTNLACTGASTKLNVQKERAAAAAREGEKGENGEGVVMRNVVYDDTDHDGSCRCVNCWSRLCGNNGESRFYV